MILLLNVLANEYNLSFLLLFKTAKLLTSSKLFILTIMKGYYNLKIELLFYNKIYILVL